MCVFIGLFIYIVLKRNFRFGSMKYIILFILICMIATGCLLVTDSANSDSDITLFTIDFIFIPAIAVVIVISKIIYEIYFVKTVASIASSPAQPTAAERAVLATPRSIPVAGGGKKRKGGSRSKRAIKGLAY